MVFNLPEKVYRGQSDSITTDTERMLKTVNMSSTKTVTPFNLSS